MQSSLLVEDSQKPINQENDISFVFIDEIQFYISQHNTVNSIISFFIYLFLIIYQFLSSLPIAPLDNPEILLIDYLYGFFTGAISNPTITMVYYITFFFDIFIITIFFLTFLLTLYIFTTTIHMPFAIKTIAICWYYLIPFLTPLHLVVFSRAYNHLSIIDNSMLIFLTIFSNIILYSIILLIGIFNTISAYQITHTFSSLQAFRVVILVFFVCLSHQLIGFVSSSTMSLLIVTILIQFFGVIYFTIYPNYKEQWLTVLSLNYYLYSFAISIIRVVPVETTFWIPFVGLIISFLGAFTLTEIPKRLFYMQFGYLNHFFEKKKLKPQQLLNHIESLDLNSFRTYKLQLIVKLDRNISPNVLNLINTILISKHPQSFLNSFFMFMLQKRLTVMTFDDVLYRFQSLRSEFWTSVYNSNFSSLSEIAAKIGHDRLVYRENLLFRCMNNQDLVEQVKESFKPNTERKSKNYFFHFIILMFFCMSILLQLNLTIMFRRSYTRYVRFTDVRSFVSCLTIIQVELWPLGSLGNNFHILKKLWTKIEQDELFDAKMNDVEYRVIINNYLNEINNYNLTHVITNEVTDIRVMKIFSILFRKSNGFFNETFSENASRIPFVLLFLFVSVLALYLISFLVLFLYFNSQEKKFFTIFQSFSKSKIKQFLINQNDETEITVPIPSKKFEWHALKYFVWSLLLSFISVSLYILIPYLEYYQFNIITTENERYKDKLGSLELAFAFYSAAVFYENIKSLPYSQILEAASNSDTQFNKLFGLDMAEIVPASILKNIAFYLYQRPRSETIESVKETILMLSRNIDLNDQPLYQKDFVFFLFTIFMFFVTFSLTVFSFTAHYILIVLHYSSINEKFTFLSEYEEKNKVNHNWSTISYNRDDLPLVLVILSPDLKIKFITKQAKRIWQVDIDDDFHQINIGDISWQTELLNILEDMKNAKKIESEKVRKMDNNFTFISPSFHIENKIPILKSIIIIDSVDLSEESDDSIIFESACPYFQCEPLETVVSFKNDQIALISLKLIGLSAFISKLNKSNGSQIIKNFLITLVSKIDELKDFARISFRNNTILLISRNINFTSLNQFASICSDFGLKVQAIVNTLSNQFSASLYCSVLFHRCEAVTLKKSNEACGQCDFTSNVISFMDECHQQFHLNAIGFVPRIKTTQIQNMSKIMTIQLKNGSTADIFVYI